MAVDAALAAGIDLFDSAGNDGATDAQAKAAGDAAVTVDERRCEAHQEILGVLLPPRAIVRRASRNEHGPLPEPIGDRLQKLGDIAELIDSNGFDIES